MQEDLAQQDAAIHEPKQKAKSQKPKFFESPGNPTDDYRKLPLLPTSTELSPSYVPYLRKAIVKGCYDSDEHYLDVQYRLLREDLIQPVRKGIEDIKTGNDENLQVYKSIKLDPSSLYLQTGDFIHYANIQASFSYSTVPKIEKRYFDFSQRSKS